LHLHAFISDIPRSQGCRHFSDPLLQFESTSSLQVGQIVFMLLRGDRYFVCSLVRDRLEPPKMLPPDFEAYSCAKPPCLDVLPHRPRSRISSGHMAKHDVKRCEAANLNKSCRHMLCDVVHSLCHPDDPSGWVVCPLPYNATLPLHQILVIHPQIIIRKRTGTYKSEIQAVVAATNYSSSAVSWGAARMDVFSIAPDSSHLAHILHML
jgi:hypothetical protein